MATWNIHKNDMGVILNALELYSQIMADNVGMDYDERRKMTRDAERAQEVIHKILEQEGK